MVKPMPIYRPLSDSELHKTTDGVAIAKSLIGNEEPLTAEILQPLYDALLGGTDENPSAVEALGYAFGQLFLTHDWLEWAMIADEQYGDEIGIAVNERQLGCAPLSMVRNRLENREEWNLRQLLETTVKRLRQLGQDAARAY